MIKLIRVRTEDAIVPAFRGATPRDRLVTLMKNVREQLRDDTSPENIKLKITSKWSEAKDQLLKETHDKCAYCETSMLAVAFGDVEHYRPKSVYWWFAYVYDNYLASCAICNQRFKGKQFEFSGAQLPSPAVLPQSTDNQIEDLARTAIPDPLDAAAVAQFEDMHRLEQPLVPNPYIDDPEGVFAWDVIEGSREVEVVVRQEIPDAERILDACERIYGINRPDLKRRRYLRYEIYRNFRAALADLAEDAPSRPTIENFFRTLTAPNSEYAAMIKFLEANRQ